jgi:hypothetical protein
LTGGQLKRQTDLESADVVPELRGDGLAVHDIAPGQLAGYHPGCPPLAGGGLDPDYTSQFIEEYASASYPTIFGRE